ncbi:MAG: transcription antitermination factor NusB [Anaplasma ovis]|uniref:Transcription antitermination factor NusB n=1 Tax=Anaplasma ovis str. Haibei TaxID=1248439 RepID=A0A2Z2LGA9_9RICK|nr:transcription antitermination factor NusB [Anaplasma ovis]ASI47582.1 transcription antitermination factor NusB [Anaplasma ovis str. Haibei]
MEVGSTSDDLPWYSGKTSARFLAVQGAYSMMFSSYATEDLDGLLEHLCEMRGVFGLGRVDKKLLTKILRSMLARCSEIDATISEHINKNWSMDRINLVSLSIMRAGICELLCFSTSESVVINEYVDIASYALEDAEVDFVNAILNKAKTVRFGRDTEVQNLVSDGVALLPKSC